MVPKTHSRGVIIYWFLCLWLLTGLTGLAKGNENKIPKDILEKIAEARKRANNPRANKPTENQPGPKCVLCGRITDANTGQPVIDATVKVHHRYNAETDANGFYCLEKIYRDGEYQIEIDSNEYIGITDRDIRPVVNLSKTKQTIKNFTLESACVVEVLVVDEANQPVEGAELSTFMLGEERNKEVGRRKKTNKDGICIVGGLAANKRYMIIATHGTRITVVRENGTKIGEKKWDYAPGYLTAELNNTKVIETGRIVLKKGAEVKGYARYEDNVPASDLSIYAYPDWWSSYNSPERIEIEDDGSFTLRNIVPGIYSIYINIPRGRGSSSGIPLLHTRLPLPDNETLVLKVPEKSPQSLVSIRGKFIIPRDRTTRYVDIQVYSPKYGHKSAMWQDYIGDVCDTNFVIDRLEPGKYKLTFSSRNLKRKVLENVEAPCEDLEVELMPVETLNLTGIVINPQNGEPIQKFEARARKIRSLDGSYFSQSDKWLEFDNDEGRFNIEAVGPGIYQVQIAAEGFTWTWSEEVNTEIANVVKIKPALGGSIKGRVVDEAGLPVSGAKVYPLSKAIGAMSPMACANNLFISEDGAVETVDGVFELRHLPAGEESIKVTHPDYSYTTVNGIEVKEGQTTEGIEVKLQKGGIVEGYVYDAKGKPESNVTLHFQDDSVYRGFDEEKAGRFAAVTTDANGYYRAAGLPEEICYVKRHTEERPVMGVICRMIVPANGKVSRLDFGGQPNVTGQIVIDGVPIANRRITLSATDGQHSSIFRCYAMTEPDGRFIFGGMPKGKWQIYYEDIEKRGNWIKIADFELMESSIDLGLIPKGISTVHITIESEQENFKWDIIKAYLQEEDKPWSQKTVEIEIPTDENEPYTAKYVLPGEHYLVLIRQDYTNLRQRIVVNENDVNVIVRIPKCSAGISGHMIGDKIFGLNIWKKDRSLVGYIKPDENGNYKLDNIPAGEYWVGGNMLIDSAALNDFQLEDGEQKVFDLNLSNFLAPNENIGTVHVVILDDNGIPITAAEIWLEGKGDVIEPIVNLGQGFYFMAKPGIYTLHARFADYKEITQQVTVERFNEKNVRSARKPILIRLAR